MATLGWDADFGEPMSQYYDSVLQSITQYSALQGSIPYYKVRIMQSTTRYYYGLLRTIQSTTGSVLRSTTTYTKSCSVLHATK